MTVHANIEAIWIIIVIITVIVQVVKGARKVSSQTPGQSSQPKDPHRSPQRDFSQETARQDTVAPDQALQEFLRNLTGQPAVPPPPPPTTPKTLPSRVEKPRSAHEPRSAYAAGTATSTRKTVNDRRLPRSPESSVELEVVNQDGSTLRIDGDIKKEARNIRAIRKAIVMREILGPPLALR